MRLVIVLALVFGVGSCVGQQHGETKVDIVEVPRTKVVYADPPDPVEVPTLPESCELALRYARDIGLAAEDNYRLSGEQLDVLSLASMLLAQGKNTTPAVEAQRDLRSDTVANLSVLEEAFFMFEKYNTECKDLLK